jgi:hypothetical protein
MLPMVMRIVDTVDITFGCLVIRLSNASATVVVTAW